MKVTHVLYVAAFMGQSAPSRVPPFHGSGLRMKLAGEIYREAWLWFLQLAGQCYRQPMPFVVVIPVGKTLSKDFAIDGRSNTTPHMLVVFTLQIWPRRFSQ